MQNVPLGNDCQFYTSNQHSSQDSLTKEVVCQVTQVKSVFLVSAPHVFPLCQELSEEFYRVQRNETVGLQKDRLSWEKKQVTGEDKHLLWLLSTECWLVRASAQGVLAGGGQCMGGEGWWGPVHKGCWLVGANARGEGWWGPESRAMFRSYPLKKVQTIPALPAYSYLTFPDPSKEPI